MAIFSDRFELSKAAVIVDDAPRWLRAVLYDQVLAPYIANELAHEYRSSDKPLDAAWLVRRLAQLTREDPGTEYLSYTKTRSALRALGMNLAWFDYFNFVEIVAEECKKSDAKYSWKNVDAFGEFRQQLNSVLSTSAIGWRMNTSGQLERTETEERSLAETQLKTLEIKEPARVHIAKARLMLNQRPCDAANAIKESVSALESAGKSVFPGANTLGDVIKELRRIGAAPPMFLVLLEKLYGFASSEPGVRHGSGQTERVGRAEAEFIYTMALATMTYLSVSGNL